MNPQDEKTPAFSLANINQGEADVVVDGAVVGHISQGRNPSNHALVEWHAYDAAGKRIPGFGDVKRRHAAALVARIARENEHKQGVPMQLTSKELAELDKAVALVEGEPRPTVEEVYDTDPPQYECRTFEKDRAVPRRVYRPTRSGEDLKRLLVKYRLALAPADGGGWEAFKTSDPTNRRAGESPGVALCLAIVAFRDPAIATPKAKAKRGAK